jgi:hypothetical protein
MSAETLKCPVPKTVAAAPLAAALVAPWSGSAQASSYRVPDARQGNDHRRLTTARLPATRALGTVTPGLDGARQVSGGYAIPRAAR